jgi:TPR repeat protein
LGHCYYHGHGVKKDLFLAAKYYRKADKQGQGIMGNSWIWKSKYDTPPSSSHK